MNDLVYENLSAAVPDIANTVGNISGNIHNSIDRYNSNQHELNMQRVISNADMTLGVYQAAESVANNALSAFGSMFSAREERKVMEIQRQMQSDEYEYNLMSQQQANDYALAAQRQEHVAQYNMKKLAYQYELEKQRETHRYKYEMQVEQNRHDEFVICEQRKLLEKALDVFQATYNRKMDFFEAQLKMIDDVHREDTKLLDEHIYRLEDERNQCFNDNQKYIMLSNSIDRLHDIQHKKEQEYYAAHSKLTDAVTLLQIESQNPLLGQANNLMLK